MSEYSVEIQLASKAYSLDIEMSTVTAISDLDGGEPDSVYKSDIDGGDA